MIKVNPIKSDRQLFAIVRCFDVFHRCSFDENNYRTDRLMSNTILVQFLINSLFSCWQEKEKFLAGENRESKRETMDQIENERASRTEISRRVSFIRMYSHGDCLVERVERENVFLLFLSEIDPSTKVPLSSLARWRMICSMKSCSRIWSSFSLLISLLSIFNWFSPV